MPHLVELVLEILEQEAGGVKVSELMLLEQLVPCFGALPLRRLTWEKTKQNHQQKNSRNISHLCTCLKCGLGAKIPSCSGLVHSCKTDLTSAFTPTQTMVSK